jgi:pimeloyl-[acyl-carrier protein] methyl ester esterase
VRRIGSKPELVLLHALPFDGGMWSEQMGLLLGATHVPSLYSLGDDIGDWAKAVLAMAVGDRLIVVGCSVGGSCAIEIAVAAPERIAALVLIGTKAAHRPEPALHARALEILREDGIEAAWSAFWEPLLSPRVDPRRRQRAKQLALGLHPSDVARGVSAFHGRPDRSGFLASFQRPVHVVTGLDDVAPGLRTSAAQADAASQGHLHTIEHCGHYVPIERPDSLNALLSTIIGASSEPSLPRDRRGPPTGG